MLVKEHGGRVPRTFEELEQLPGVGHKTASVVICTAFGYESTHYIDASSRRHVCLYT